MCVCVVCAVCAHRVHARGCVALDCHRKRDGSLLLLAMRGIKKLWYVGLGTKVMITGDAISIAFFASTTHSLLP